MIMETVHSVLNVLYAHPYVFIFVGMIFAGEVVLLPSIYLAVTGRLDIAPVVALAVVATSLSDMFWYYLGRRFPAAALERLPGRGTGRVVRGLEKLFRHNGPHVLFLSKFVYGTRITAQVLSGVHDMPFRIYLGANTLGILAVTGSLVAIAYSVIGTTHRLGDVMQGVEIAFLLFVLVAAAGYLVAGKMLRRQWFR